MRRANGEKKNLFRMEKYEKRTNEFAKGKKKKEVVSSPTRKEGGGKVIDRQQFALS